MSALSPCPSCSRHIRVDETTCPFCRSAIAIEVAPRSMPTQRLGRAATFAFGAAIATSAVGCGTATAPQDANVAAADGGADGSPVPLYGAPSIDAGHDAYFGGLDAAYGGPPVDAGVDGGLSAAYGAPPGDANFPDTGTAPLYGAPPPPPAPGEP